MITMTFTKTLKIYVPWDPSSIVLSLPPVFMLGSVVSIVSKGGLDLEWWCPLPPSAELGGPSWYCCRWCLGPPWGGGFWWSLFAILFANCSRVQWRNLHLSPNLHPWVIKCLQIFDSKPVNVRINKNCDLFAMVKISATKDQWWKIEKQVRYLIAWIFSA